jgi:WD40-like Beta Propeller Repeat
MNRLPAILFITCLSSGLLTSGTIEKRPAGSLSAGHFQKIENDTSRLISLLDVDSFRLQVIPPSSGVKFFRNGIVFLSNSKDEGKMLSKHVSFGSIEAYIAIVKDTSLGRHIIFSPTSSFPYPCEAITFSVGFDTMYYTKIPKKGKSEKIYRAEFKSDRKNEQGWVSEINPLDFCTDNFTYTHPALSRDGNIMIFASDKDGTAGGMDLFVVKKAGEKWSAPENLGGAINTPGNEFFPFLDSDNNLYFSSDGLPGHGGYDIFSCKFNGVSWDKPENLSGRINTSDDDVAFSINMTDGKSAFYTVRQKADARKMQLYRVTMKKESFEDIPLTISYIFNGKPVPAAGALAAKTAEPEKEPAAEPAKKVPDEVRKEEPKTVTTKAPAAASSQAVTTNARVVTIKSSKSLPEELKDKVIYRVQFLSSSKPRKEEQITMNGVTYATYEYFYLGAYRYSIGVFTNLAAAAELQNICRKSGYPQAFVAAFKNDTRSLDLKFFK